MINTSLDKIKDALEKGVVNILPDRESLAKLMRKRKIRIYWGIDPTGQNIHLGHTIPLRKLKQFQDLGHEIILLVGSFTAQLGDPSGKDSKRKALTLNDVKKNMASYKKQASKIIDLKKAKTMYNGDWLSKLKFDDLIKLASNFTVSRLLERDMFQKRLKEKKEIWVSELLYPLMQGYDSVAMDVDLEIGGNDQTFNMLVGRKLQKIYNNREKYVLTTEMLIGLDGREMSKTFGNFVNIADAPNDMFGKLMSLRDDLIIHYFKLCTDFPLSDIKKMEDELRSGKINPKNLKLKLAEEITKIYHGKKKSELAKKEFESVFAKKEIPSKIKTVRIRAEKINILELLVRSGQVKSKSEAKRLVSQNSIEIDGIVKKDWTEAIKPQKGSVVKIGKRRFFKIS